jgi:hypothetical protein
MGWAGQVGERTVRQQYEREFGDRFWERFGWKRAGGPRPVAAPGPRAVAPIVVAQSRVALAGVLRFPDAAASSPDALAALHLASRAQTSLRDALVEALWAQPGVTTDVLRGALAAAGHGSALAALDAVPVPACAQDTAQLLEALAALAANDAQRRDARAALARVLGEGEIDDGPLQARLDVLTERVRALLAARQRLLSELLDREQARPMAAARSGRQRTQAGGTNGEDSDGGGDAGGGEGFGGSRRAAH